MDVEFANSIIHLIGSLNLTLCSSLQSNSCMKDRGICLLTEENQPTCICSPCFTGDHCEEEKSRNLWYLGMSSNARIQMGNEIIKYIIGVSLVLNGLLCLQTYLCRKIRQTNLGIYLIMLSITMIVFGFVFLVSSAIKHIDRFHFDVSISCLYETYGRATFFRIYTCFIAAAAIERVLVECFVNYGLHDSRHRSVIFSLVIIISSILAILPNIFTVRDSLLATRQSTYCMDFTPVGYVIYSTIRCIHLFAFYFVYILMNIIVLAKLFRRRQRFLDNSSTIKEIYLILKKHKDFFIPYLIQSICLLPIISMELVVTCPTANTMLVAYTHLIFNALQIFAVAITFYLYVCLSPVYLSIFWSLSPVGRCLTNIHHKLRTIYHKQLNGNNILMETYT